MPEITSQLSTALADRYKIERHIGEGGMATVYLAHDMKHDRKVALKVLRPELAAVIGGERFLNEIKVTANLQHPHILPLHDSGEADSFLYYVMPYVEGDTLRDKIDREKQLGVDEAVEITKSVAAALDYAHRQDVVHRDIKPENILIHDGQALVADFGIALAVSEASGKRLTETGLSIGTPHYMSPEQAMGDRELDARSDVYSLGAMLYEMLAGDPPYTGSTAQAIVAKVITEKAAPVTTHRDTVPPHIAAAISKCLEKLPADRFTSAAKFSDAVSNPSFTLPATQLADAPRAPAATRTNRVLVGVATLLAITTVWGFWPKSEPAPPVTRLTLALPDDTGLVSIPRSPIATLSPDGRTIVFMGPSGGNLWQLWARPLDRLSATPIPGTVRGHNWSFSPSGDAVVYQVGQGLGSLQVVSLSGAPPLTLTDSAQLLGGDWGDDGYVYFTNVAWGLSRIPATGGAIETVTVLDSVQGHGMHIWPDALPGGRGLLFVHAPEVFPNPSAYSIGVLDLESGAFETILRGAYARFAESGHIVYVTTEGSVHAVAFDPERLEVTSPAIPLLDGIRLKQFGAVDLAISVSGSMVYVGGTFTAGADELVWVSRTDGSVAVIDPGWTRAFSTVALSPDDASLAVTIDGGDGTEIWVKELDQGPQSKLTFEPSTNNRAVWSPDGRTLMFVSDRAGNRDLWAKRADGSAEAVRIHDYDDHIDQGIYSNDGEWLVFRVGIGPRDILGLRLGIDTIPVPLVADAGYDEYNPQLSPDGRWLAYTSDETGGVEVYVRPFPNTNDARWLASNGGGRAPRWAHSGNELFYLTADGDLVAAEVRSDPTFSIGKRTVLFSARTFQIGGFHTNYDVTSDDQRFVFIRSTVEAATSNLILVQNWFEVLKDRVGND